MLESPGFKFGVLWCRVPRCKLSGGTTAATFRAVQLFFATATPEAREDLVALQDELKRLVPSSGLSVVENDARAGGTW